MNASFLGIFFVSGKIEKLFSSPSDASQCRSDSRKQSDSTRPIRAVGRLESPKKTGPIYGKIRDICESGCFFDTEASLESDDTVAVQITVTGKGHPITLDLEATVAESDGDGDRQSYELIFSETRAPVPREARNLAA